MSEWVQILKELSEASGVPGQEQEVRELMRTYLEPYTEELSTDNLGSIVGRKTGIAGATVQEEVGLRGAGTSTTMIGPDLFIAIRRKKKESPISSEPLLVWGQMLAPLI